MKYTLILLCALSVTVYSQSQFSPSSQLNGAKSAFGASCLTMTPESSAEVSAPSFSHEGLSKNAKSSFTSSGLVSPIGVGAMARMNYMQSEISAMQFTSGFMALRDGAHSNLEGGGVFASVVPMFVGMRYNLATLKARSMEWTQYAAFGAGPIMGIQYGDSYSFWQTINKMGFRWGAGAYAGLGSEMRFTQGVGLYAQLELTGFGFTAPLLDRQTYLGPSFSFGIMFFPS